MTAGIFLAAGRSQRFGANKLLLDIEGKPLLYYSLKNCVDSLLPVVHVVLGAQYEELEDAIRHFFSDTARISIVVNEDYERGMMSSLKKGIRSFDPGCPGAMVFLADMPMVTPDIIDHLIDSFEAENKIIIPECHGELYHPRIIPSRFFPDFLQLDDDEKGTKILEKESEEIVRVSIGNKTNYVDIDHLGDIGPIFA